MTNILIYYIIYTAEVSAYKRKGGKTMDNKKELNEFELEIVSGGGSANFGADKLRTPEAIEKLAKSIGTSTRDINKCLKNNGMVDVNLGSHVVY